MLLRTHLPLRARRAVAKDTVEVVFERAESFPFQAGQYVTMTVPGLEGHALSEARHDFSIVSAPHEKSEVRIATRISQSLFKQKLLSLPLGAEVYVEGPKGNFLPPADDENAMVGVAGGIGITPFMSFVSEAARRGHVSQFTLIYVDSSRERAPYLPALEELSREHPFFSIHFSSALSEKAFPLHTKEFLETPWYVAGPPGFVFEARKTADRLMLPRKLFFSEDFAGYE